MQDAAFWEVAIVDFHIFTERWIIPICLPLDFLVGLVLLVATVMESCLVVWCSIPEGMLTESEMLAICLLIDIESFLIIDGG